jgi:uncharacterized membrane protein YhaH (DUF805 family)
MKLSPPVKKQQRENKKKLKKLISGEIIDYCLAVFLLLQIVAYSVFCYQLNEENIEGSDSPFFVIPLIIAIISVILVGLILIKRFRDYGSNTKLSLIIVSMALIALSSITTYLLLNIDQLDSSSEYVSDLKRMNSDHRSTVVAGIVAGFFGVSTAACIILNDTYDSGLTLPCISLF